MMYRPGLSGYSVVILLRRFVLVALYVLVSPAERALIWLTAVNDLAAMLQVACWPYRRRQDNVLELMTLIALFLQSTVLLARPLPWSTQVGATTGSSSAASILLLLLLVVLPCCTGLVMALWGVGHWLAEHMRHWIRSHADGANQPQLIDVE